MTKYCTKKYILPKKAFAGLFWTVSADEKLLIHNMFQVYSDLETLIADARQYINIIKKENVTILNEGMILPLKLKTTFNLNQKYWENPSIDIDPFSRIIKNIELLKFPTAYDLLVTPAGITNGKETFSFTFPFLAGYTTKDIEAFMLASNHPVPTNAKNAGLYTVSDPIGINWVTKRIVKDLPEEATPSLKN